jgi:hypothetical protein
MCADRRSAPADAGAEPDSRDLLCPSAQPDVVGAVAIGMVDHASDALEVAFLEKPLPASSDLLAMCGPIRPTEIFRFAAGCQTTACTHWDGQDCKLVDRIVRLVPAGSLVLPKCHIRNGCRWYAQAGREACSRCPQVITQNEQPTDSMREAASPK